MKKAIIILIFAAISIYSYAQIETSDTLSIGNLELPDSSGHILPDSNSWRNTSAPYHSMYGLHSIQPRIYGPTEIPVFHPAPIYPGIIALWGSGGITGSTRQLSMPGLMRIEQGRISIHQSVGNFTFSTYGEALKYGYYRGLDTSFGFGGSIDYRLSDRVSLTFFGSYYTYPGQMSPAMAGYVSIPKFGGFIDYRVNNKWGIQVGAQSYRSSMTHRWETQPIVMPYFRISKKDIIGIDIGGMLYQFLKSNAEKRVGHMGNPTIPTPVP